MEDKGSYLGQNRTNSRNMMRCGTTGFTVSYPSLSVFFFQAEDGIRDTSVTGVQTCALPIYNPHFLAFAATRSCRRASRRTPGSGGCGGNRRAGTAPAAFAPDRKSVV